MRTLAIITLFGCSTTVNAPHPNATVRAYDDGTGAGGRVAVFADARGQLKAVELTDRFGVAPGVVNAGDMVTIANVGAPKFELTTYVGIGPGDEMVIGETEDEAAAGAADVGALVVGVDAVPTGMHAEVGVGLSMIPHAGRPLALNLNQHMFANAAPTVQVLGIARDDGGVARAFAIGEASGAGVVTLPAWRTDWERVKFAISGVAPASTIEARVAIVQGDGRFPSDPVTTAQTAFDIAVPPGLGSGLEYEVAVRDGASTRSIVELGESRSVTVDAGSLLPAVTSPVVAPRADSRPLVSWTVADAARADFTMVQLSWGDGAHRWTIVLPPTHAGTFRLPELPDSLASWRPAGDLHVGVALVELSTIASYHDLMKRGVVELDKLDAKGTVRISRAGEIDF